MMTCTTTRNLNIIFKISLCMCTHQTWGQFNSGIGIDYLKEGIGIEKF